MPETELYHPIKAFLEALGYSVKGEVGGCDVLGMIEGEPPVLVICEMKLSFSLELVLQGVDRAALCDEVWLAARLSRAGKGREGDARFRNLCRRLGFGMLGITAAGEVQVLVAPFAGTPRKDKRRRSRLVEEHRRRKGDPMLGGSSRAPVMTAYRQQALACAAVLSQGPCRPRDLRAMAPKAPAILRDNVYGWFQRVERGVYCLTEEGAGALMQWPEFGATLQAEGAATAGDQDQPLAARLAQARKVQGSR